MVVGGGTLVFRVRIPQRDLPKRLSTGCSVYFRLVSSFRTKVVLVINHLNIRLGILVVATSEHTVHHHHHHHLRCRVIDEGFHVAVSSFPERSCTPDVVGAASCPTNSLRTKFASNYIIQNGCIVLCLCRSNILLPSAEK